MSHSSWRNYSEDGQYILCNTCGEWKPVDYFPAKGSICNQCRNKKSSETHTNSLRSRVIAAQNAQELRAGYFDPELDDLTEQDLRDMLAEQEGYCACPGCSVYFEHISDYEIAHIKSPMPDKNGVSGHLTRLNLQLVCEHHNARGKSPFSFTRFFRGNKDENGDEYGLIIQGLK